jgi:hypothetical protein
MGKKIWMVFLAAIAAMLLCGNAIGGVFTWDDIYKDPAGNVYLSTSKPLYHFSHDIGDGDNGFVPGQDLIYSYSLTVTLLDDIDKICQLELAFVNQPGYKGDGFYTFSSTSKTFGWSIAGLAMLNASGFLDVDIFAVWGDFFFAESKLTAHGYDAYPHAVTEPGAMMVLGAGLFGLAGCARKRFKR